MKDNKKKYKPTVRKYQGGGNPGFEEWLINNGYDSNINETHAQYEELYNMYLNTLGNPTNPVTTEGSEKDPFVDVFKNADFAGLADIFNKSRLSAEMAFNRTPNIIEAPTEQDFNGFFQQGGQPGPAQLQQLPSVVAILNALVPDTSSVNDATIDTLAVTDPITRQITEIAELERLTPEARLEDARIDVINEIVKRLAIQPKEEEDDKDEGKDKGIDTRSWKMFLKEALPGNSSSGIAELQSGGLVNISGYLDNAKTNKNPINIIPSNKITMDGVSRDLLGIGDNGVMKLMKGGSGEYDFGNAKAVLEVPVMADGGKPDSNKTYKNGQTKKSWRKGKKMAIYMDGSWHHFGEAGAPDKRTHKDEDRAKRFRSRHAEALKGDSPRAKAFRKYADITWADGGQPKKYKHGGRAVGGNSVRNVITSGFMKVGNEDKIPDGFIPTENLIPIQTEKGEMIVLPTMDIVPVAANKKHSKMDDNEVTDVVPENSYIFSNYGGIQIKRGDAEKIVIEEEIKPYNFNSKNEPPRVKTLADIMGKNDKMVPAKLAKKIDSMYKLKQDGDIFDQSTSQENRITRAPYIKALIGLSEIEKGRKGMDIDLEAFKMGGRVMKLDKNIKEYQKGGKAKELFKRALDLRSGIAILDFLSGADKLEEDKNRINETTDRLKGEYDNLYNRLTQQQALSTGIGIASILAQDPTVDYARQNRLNLQTEIPFAYTDYGINRAFANRPYLSGLRAGDAAAIQGQYNASVLEAASQAAATAGLDRINRQNQQRIANNQIDFGNESIRIGAANATRAGNNQLAGNIGAQGQNFFTNIGRFDANNVNSQTALDINRVNFLTGQKSKGQAYLDFGVTVANTLSNFIPSFG